MFITDKYGSLSINTMVIPIFLARLEKRWSCNNATFIAPPKPLKKGEKIYITALFKATNGKSEALATYRKTFQTFS